MVGLWSGEVLHTLRLRAASFRAVCPDDPAALIAWLEGGSPGPGVTSTFLLLDPQGAPRRRRWIGLDEALPAKPRYRGYADAAAKLAQRA
jgi:hypothetical protein